MLGKFLWLLVVCLGFIAAGIIINEAYIPNKESVATSITMHPLADLDFPMVTVCPPKGSHTALNYDLMKADNNSLTEKERITLRAKVQKLFVQQ